MATATDKIWLATEEQATGCRLCELAAYGSAASLKQWQKLLSDPATVAIAIGDYNKPLAVAVARSVAADQFRLLIVAVAPDQRRRGNGKLLVKLLGESGELLLQLRETATESLKFAVSAGFHPLRLDRNCYSDCDGVILSRK